MTTIYVMAFHNHDTYLGHWTSQLATFVTSFFVNNKNMLKKQILPQNFSFMYICMCLYTYCVQA